LLDEAEELLHLHAQDPTFLRKLRRALQSQEGIRTVMASGPRLWRLAEQRDDTSPFLHGFAPPLHLGPLPEEAARALVLRGRFDEITTSELVRRSGRHPSLLQLLCLRTLELGDLERATESVLADPTVRHFFAVDFDLLTPREREVAVALARAERPEREGIVENPRFDPTLPAEGIRAAKHQLERLGLLRRDGGGRSFIGCPLFASWLRETSGSAPARLV